MMLHFRFHFPNDFAFSCLYSKKGRVKNKPYSEWSNASIYYDMSDDETEESSEEDDENRNENTSKRKNRVEMKSAGNR